MQKRFRGIMIGILVLLFFVVVISYLYKRPDNVIEYDGAYYWNELDTIYDAWRYAKSPTGWEYYLHLPPDVDPNDKLAKVPMIVTFHGQSGKYITLTRQGRVFMNRDFQEKSGGCAVLVMTSRGDTHYFSDPHSCARLIKNLSFKYPCLDMDNITAFGHSQGAAFVVELAVCDPGLLRAVIASSGYYQASMKDVLRVLPVQFFTAVSEDDDGIFEPGSATGKKLGRFCHNSRYVQYQTRGHLQLELKDKSGHGDETLESWLLDVMAQR